MPLSPRLSLCPRRVAGSHRTTRLGSTFCLSPPGSACVLAKSRARTAQQGFGPSFASLYYAHRDCSPSRELAPQDKAWVHALPLSTTLSVSPRQVAGLHPWTRLGSTFCLSPSGSACLLAGTRARTPGQGLGPRSASLHQAQRVSSLSRGLAPVTRLGSTLCLSPPSLALLLDKSLARNLGQGLGLRFAFLHRLSVSPHRVA